MGVGDLNPGQILRRTGGFWAGFTIMAGVRLDLFTVIGREALTGAELARRLNGDERGMTTLLNGLAALELLAKEDDRFCQTELSATFLDKASKRYLGYIVNHHHHLIEAWSKLDQAALTGKPTDDDEAWRTDEVREAFLMGMFNLAMALAPEVAGMLDLAGRERLLDLGGGPGTWAIHFCRANPGLKATVFDRPTSRPFAEQTIARFELTERIDFVGGDFLEDELPTGFDAAWLSHVLHSQGPEESALIVARAARSLNPGGMVIIHEFLLNEDLAGPVFPALFSLNMLTGTNTGRSYSTGHLTEMLTRAGAKEVEVPEWRAHNDSGILIGRF